MKDQVKVDITKHPTMEKQIIIVTSFSFVGCFVVECQNDTINQTQWKKIDNRLGTWCNLTALHVDVEERR